MSPSTLACWTLHQSFHSFEPQIYYFFSLLDNFGEWSNRRVILIFQIVADRESESAPLCTTLYNRYIFVTDNPVYSDKQTLSEGILTGDTYRILRIPFHMYLYTYIPIYECRTVTMTWKFLPCPPCCHLFCSRLGSPSCSNRLPSTGTLPRLPRSYVFKYVHMVR